MRNARVTRFRMREGTREDALAALDDLRDEIMALPGVSSVLVVRNTDREGMVIAINDSLSQADTNAAKAAALWAKFAQFMTALPQTDDYEVLAHWD